MATWIHRVVLVACVAAVPISRAHAQDSPRFDLAYGLPVVFEGNLVLPDESYVAVLSRVPISVESTVSYEELSYQINHALTDFLHESGYELATVITRVVDDEIVVRIDEGLLTKIVFRGRNTFRTLQLKLRLDLPHQVYNRPKLIRQLEALRRSFGITSTQFELVPTSYRDGTLELESLPLLEGFTDVPPAGQYELHVTLGRREWGEGLGVHLSIRASDGVILGGSYSGESLFFERDRWRLRADASAKLFASIDESSRNLRPARAILDVRWYTPPIFETDFRPFIWAYSDLMLRQRRNLRIERFRWLQTAALLNLGYDVSQGLALSLGAGIEHQYLFGIDQVEPLDNIPIQEGRTRLRGLWAFRSELSFDPDIVRLDRRHELTLEIRNYFTNPRMWRTHLDYRKVFAFGWHDMWLRLGGTALFGRKIFPEEEPVSNYVRGVFSEIFYVSRVAGIGLEFRFSISRDLLKVGVYSDLAAFQDRGIQGDERILRFASSHGLGFHALLLDVMQFDIYYGVGFATDGDTDHGPSARLSKAF